MKPVVEKKTEFQGFNNGRQEGRDLEEFRPFCFRTKVLSSCPGSAYASLGSEESNSKTEVIVSIDGPKPSQRIAAEKAELNVEIQFASLCKRKFESNSSELRRLECDVRQCFESSIILTEYPKSRIGIIVVVLQDDGEIFATIVNATSLAVASAGIAMRDLVSAVTVYAVQIPPSPTPVIVVDMNGEEEDFYKEQRVFVSSVTLGLCAREGSVAFIRSMGSHLSEETHELMLGVGEHAVHELADEMRACLKGEEDEI